MTKWTTDQLKAIKESGKNIIVSAGAGSGKTAVLSQRVIHLLEKGIKVNELLILTFTNAAAGEILYGRTAYVNKNKITGEMTFNYYMAPEIPKPAALGGDKKDEAKDDKKD